MLTLNKKEGELWVVSIGGNRDMDWNLTQRHADIRANGMGQQYEENEDCSADQG